MDGDPLNSLVIILVCLCLSFLFAGSETAITSMGEHRVRRLLDDGVGPRRFLQAWLDDHASILTSLLAGNTLVNIIASAVTTSMALQLSKGDVLPPQLQDWALTVGVFFLTLSVLVVGEIAPKTLAKSHPTWFLRPFWLVWFFHVATRPLTRGLSWFAKLLIQLLGVDTAASGFVVTEEQIEDMVRIGSEEGSIDGRRGDLLQNVFDLWDTPIRAIMTPRTQVIGLELAATYAEIVDIVRENGYSRYPVFDGSPDEVAGIFYAKTLLNEEVDRATFVLADHLSPTKFVPETQKAAAVLKQFQKQKVHMAVVVDEHGGTAGVVSLEDVLEELVGEIYDEHDEVENPVHELGPNLWVVDASCELRTVEESIDVELPEETPYSTVGGFVVDLFGKLPTASESLTWQNLKITVLEADDKKVLRVELERTTDVDDSMKKAG